MPLFPPKINPAMNQLDTLQKLLGGNSPMQQPSLLGQRAAGLDQNDSGIQDQVANSPNSPSMATTTPISSANVTTPSNTQGPQSMGGSASGGFFGKLKDMFKNQPIGNAQIDPVTGMTIPQKEKPSVFGSALSMLLPALYGRANGVGLIPGALLGAAGAHKQQESDYNDEMKQYLAQHNSGLDTLYKNAEVGLQTNQQRQQADQFQQSLSEKEKHDEDLVKIANQKKEDTANNAKLPDPEVEKISDYKTLLDALDSVQQSYDPKYVGPGKPTIANYSKFVTPIDANQTKFIQNTAAFDNLFRHSLFGSRLTPNEIEQYSKQATDLNSQSGNYEQQLKGLKDFIYSKFKNQVESANENFHTKNYLSDLNKYGQPIVFGNKTNDVNKGLLNQNSNVNAPQLSEEDTAMIEWAKNNKNNPTAQQILKMHNQ